MNLARTLLLKPSGPLKVLLRGQHLEWSPNWRLDKTIWDRYACLPIPECKVQATYVWIDGTGEHLRSKVKTLDFLPSTHKECPSWDFDGSSAYLACAENSDVVLCPVALYKDPFTKGKNRIILCETYTFDHKTTPTNHRKECMETLNCVCDSEPQFGIEQEFQLMDVNERPFGWPIMLGEPAPAGPYYCSVGASRAYGRDIIESVYRACLYSGVTVSGINAEVNPSQWEIQTGPSAGIKAADDLWMIRFFLHRVAEDFGVAISFHPKLFPNWNGAGCHVNFSTKGMRDENGMACIEEAINKLEKNHAEHIKICDVHGGLDNIKRLTGTHETSAIDKFTWGIGDRSASVRIPKRVADAKKGYLEDRRPCANVDPYLIINSLIKTCLFDK